MLLKKEFYKTISAGNYFIVTIYYNNTIRKTYKTKKI